MHLCQPLPLAVLSIVFCAKVVLVDAPSFRSAATHAV